MNEVIMEKKVIWVPTFKKSNKIMIDKPSLFSNLKLFHKDRKFRIVSLSEDSTFEFCHDKDIDKCIEIEPDPQDIVIDYNFYFAIVHYNLMKKLNIPSIYTIYSQKEDWIKA